MSHINLIYHITTKHIELNIPQTSRHLSTLPHRPHPLPSRSRTIPLMQTFTTSSAPRARADTSTIDYFVLPPPETLHQSSSSSSGEPPLRVPLLPDNFTTMHAPETPDGPLLQPEICVVAADPDNVSAVSPLTEVEGMGADGVELGFVHGLGKKSQKEERGGMIRDLWKGLVEDVFGEEQPKVKPA
jgi:hypothetical protein